MPIAALTQSIENELAWWRRRSSENRA